MSKNINKNNCHHQIVVVGGGAAGLTFTAQLLCRNSQLDVAIIEPSTKHYYQPAWTLVGAGEYKAEDTVRDEKDYIPAGATWIQDYVEKLDPEQNLVITRKGTQISYDYLVVCSGIQIDWHLIKGLSESLGKEGVCSNYSYQTVSYTWEAIKNFKGGNALFTFPSTPIKCPGAPQKIMYLADDAFRRNGVRDKSKIMYCAAGAKIFSIDAYAKTLMEVVQRKGLELKFLYNLKEIKSESKEAIFDFTTDSGIEEVTLNYDLIHVTPPMSAPDFIKQSKLAVPSSPLGWVDVDKHSLQHNVYPNVFAIGDCTSAPNSKTAAAVRRQAPVVVENILTLLAKKTPTGSYNGYACCPLVTGYGKTIMAEFDYTAQPCPTFPIDQTQEHYSMWLIKKYGLPWVYWNRMLKGKPFEADFLKWLQPVKN